MASHASFLPYLLLFIAVVAIVQTLYLVLRDLVGRTEGDIPRRLRRIGVRPAAGEGAELLRHGSLSDGKSPWLARLLQTGLIKRFDNLVATSGISLSTERAILIMALATTAIFEAIELLASPGLLVSAAASTLVALVLPLLLLSRLRARRMQKIAMQLPDALDMLVRSLKAGHPVATGIGMVAHEMAEPIGSEFALVFDEMSYGLDLREALEKMRGRLRLAEVNYMTVALRIQHDTGGNLAEVLGSLASVMRDRMRLRAKVRALSAEARFSGRILSLLPIGVVLVLLYINPHYYDLAATSPKLRFVLGGAVFDTLVGIFLLQRLVNIRI